MLRIEIPGTLHTLPPMSCGVAQMVKNIQPMHGLKQKVSICQAQLHSSSSVLLGMDYSSSRLAQDS